MGYKLTIYLQMIVLVAVAVGGMIDNEKKQKQIDRLRHTRRIRQHVYWGEVDIPHRIQLPHNDLGRTL